MIWGGSSELIASHVILQLFSPHRSVGYIRCVLQGPGNNRGQECQIVLFHMAVFIDAWLGSAPGNHRGRMCVWLCARKT